MQSRWRHWLLQAHMRAGRSASNTAAGPAHARGGGPGPSSSSARAQPTQHEHWERPQDVGLYCERQHQGQCGAHALNALFGKQAVLPGADGTYLIPHLRESCEELAAAGYAHNMQRCVTAGTPHSNGWYSVTALNHYIYEHADDTNMMLARVFINEGRPAMVASREQLLEDAPPGCNAFLMLAGRHFTTWAQSPTDQQWYKLDSIPFSSSGRVRRLQSLDWEHFQGEAYCMVRSDPYIAGETLHESLHYDPPRMHEAAWVDATQLQLSRHRQHKVIQACQLYEWGPDAQEQGQAAPEPIQVEEQMQMDEQAPPAHAPAHAAAPPEPMQMDEQAPPARAPVQGPQQQRRHPPAASAKRTQYG